MSGRVPCSLSSWTVGVGVLIADKELTVANMGQVRVPEERRGAQVGRGDEVVVLVRRVDDFVVATHLLHCDPTVFHCVASCFDEHLYLLLCNFDCVNYLFKRKKYLLLQFIKKSCNLQGG
jgi:hypothetical protein